MTTYVKTTMTVLLPALDDYAEQAKRDVRLHEELTEAGKKLRETHRDARIDVSIKRSVRE